jgi:hypothetical protein
MMITPELIAELEELLSKATPGEWLTGKPARGGWSVRGFYETEYSQIARGLVSDNATFIARAHNALPALLSAAKENLRLRACISAYGALNEFGYPWFECAEDSWKQNRRLECAYCSEKHWAPALENHAEDCPYRRAYLALQSTRASLDGDQSK